MNSVKLILFTVIVVEVKGLSDEEIHRLPKLFHLDDYDRCLSREDGLYCVGTFELAPETENNTLYSLIEENQKELYSFDRRLLHRGYCLSTRCPSKDFNTTLRFEQCANKHLHKYALTAHLKKLSYCTNPAERKAKETQAPDWPQSIFLYVVYLILFLNILGTFYDEYEVGKKNSLLMAWSLPSNWKRLTTTDDGATTSFAPFEGFKILMHLLVTYAHSSLLHVATYMYNTEILHKHRRAPMITIIRNGTSLVQLFVLITSFQVAYTVLSTARRSAISMRLVARWILKRIFRIAPVYLLITAYAATWWPRAGDGPVWSPIVGTESAICRRKFWTHVLFINNFVEPTELCLLQSWAMAVDIQLFLVSLLLIILLLKLKVRTAPVLGVMFVTSCVFNVILAYVADLLPMVKILVPEVMRVFFRGSRSFFHLHISPWSNLPACLLGLLVAHIYFEQQNKTKDVKEKLNYDKPVSDNSSEVNKNNKEDNELGFKENELRNRKYLTEDIGAKEVKEIAKVNERKQKSEEKKSIKETFGNQNATGLVGHTKCETKKDYFLLRNAHYIALPSLTMWMLLGSYIQDVDSKPAVALYVGLERLMFSVLCAWHLLHIMLVEGVTSRFMGWRGWTVPSRLLFSVVMVHWCINATIVASKPQPVVTTLLDISIDWLATLFYSFLAALPVSLLVEMPMKKVGDVVISLF